MDQSPEVGNQFYGHGAFMGAARPMLDDPLWNRILGTLMPDVHADVRGVLEENTLIPMLENNPVLAAYALTRTLALDQDRVAGRSDRVAGLRAVEWDVFLEPETVRGYGSAADDAARAALDAALVDTMLIAHGNTLQTIVENKVGLSQYGAVLGTRKSAMGGTRPGAWLDLFARALRLATTEKPDALLAAMANAPRRSDADDQSLFQTFAQPLPFQEAIDLYQRLSDKEQFSVLLDLKSRNAAPPVLRRLVGELNRRGVHVYGVGSFDFADLHQLDALRQQVAGRELAAPLAIKFVHGIGHIQSACAGGEIFPGDVVMFNAGSILESAGWEPARPDAADAAIEEILAGLRRFRARYGFQLGLYVQEAATDRHAARTITSLSNRNPDLFDLGFAWGGIANDMGRITGGGSGMGAQGMIPGARWELDEAPGALPNTGFEDPFHLQRHLKSRQFEVRRGRVEVTISAAWDSEPAPADAYSLTLRRSDWLRDTTYEGHSVEVGKEDHVRWEALEDGTYYLEIALPASGNAILHGTVIVRL